LNSEKEENKEIKLSGRKALTTNNEMELTAVLESLKWAEQHFPEEKPSIQIFLDSEYVRKGVVEYMEDWKKRGWKTVKKKLIKNLELRQEVDQYLQLFEIQWKWVKGHAGNKYNEMADKLATNKL
jgi:ribonuclease HI